MAEQAHYQAILLAVCPPARGDIYLLLTQPGADRIFTRIRKVGVRYYCYAGKALVGLTEAPEELAEGDTFVIPATVRISLKALEPHRLSR